MSVPNALIAKAAKKAGVPVGILQRQVGAESGGNQGAVSSAGARGVMQLMPGTASYLSRKYGVNTNTTYGNLLGGAYYLREQYNTFGRWDYALAAYNAGAGSVKTYHGVPPFTKDYVNQIMHGQSGSQTPGLGSTPAPPGAAPPVLPTLTPEQMQLQGLSSLGTGEFDPSKQLGDLLNAQQLAASNAKTMAAWRQSNQGTTQTTQTNGKAGGFLPAGAAYKPGRLDQGHDFQTRAGGPIIAPGDGRVVSVKSDPKGFGPSYPVVHFTSGPYAGRTLYIGHTISSLGPGQSFKQGQTISRTGSQPIGNASVPGWAEIGFAPGGSPGVMGQPAPF